MRVFAAVVAGVAGVTITLPAAGLAQDAAGGVQRQSAASQADVGASIERLDPAFDALIAPDATVRRVASGFSFTEGPLWHGGRLWFSDVAGNKLRSVDVKGNVTEILANSGGLANAPAKASIGSNGLTVDRDGQVLMVQMGARRIVHVDERGKVTAFISEDRGRRLNSPNDLVYASDGALWFTDPPFGLFNGMNNDPAKELPYNAVYRYADGVLNPVITDLKLPNGIDFSPDGSVLYVGDYANGTIYAWSVGKGGALSNRRTVITISGKQGERGGVDGMKVDRLGNIWTTGPGGIWVVSPADGKILGRIHMPEVSANLAFGEGGNALWITASTSVYRLPIRKGVGRLPYYAR